MAWPKVTTKDAGGSALGTSAGLNDSMHSPALYTTSQNEEIPKRLMQNMYRTMGKAESPHRDEKPELPDHHNQKFGSYVGYYSKYYAPAYDGSLRKVKKPRVNGLSTDAWRKLKMEGKQTKIQAYLDRVVCTRDENNHEGADADYE